MEYRVRPESEASVLELEGAVDASQSSELLHQLEVLAGSDGALLVVDLGGVTLIDSSGIGAFVTAHRGATARGATMVLARPSESVGRVFSLTRTDRLLHIAPSVEEALASPSAE